VNFHKPQWWIALALGATAHGIAFSIDWRLLGLVLLAQVSGMIGWDATDD
jgi:hypothetical protein